MTGPLQSTEGNLVASSLTVASAVVVAWITARVRPRKASVVEEWREWAEKNEAHVERLEERVAALDTALRDAQAETVRCDDHRRRQDLLIRMVLLPEIDRLRSAADLAPLAVPSVLADLLSDPDEGETL